MAHWPTDSAPGVIRQLSPEELQARYISSLIKNTLGITLTAVCDRFAARVRLLLLTSADHCMRVCGVGRHLTRRQLAGISAGLG